MTDDPDWVREFRRILNNELPGYVRDLAEAVPTSVVKDIVNDFRSYNPHPAQDPAAKVVPQGAGRVIDGSDAPVASTGTGGWVTPPQVDQWKGPPGIEHVDRLLDQADAIDKAERIRQLAEAAAVQRALKPAEPKVQEPKARGGKKQA
jgi:hypothetical protein